MRRSAALAMKPIDQNLAYHDENQNIPDFSPDEARQVKQHAPSPMRVQHNEQSSNLYSIDPSQSLPNELQNAPSPARELIERLKDELAQTQAIHQSLSPSTPQEKTISSHEDVFKKPLSAWERLERDLKSLKELKDKKAVSVNQSHNLLNIDQCHDAIMAATSAVDVAEKNALNHEKKLQILTENLQRLVNFLDSGENAVPALGIEQQVTLSASISQEPSVRVSIPRTDSQRNQTDPLETPQFVSHATMRNDTVSSVAGYDQRVEREGRGKRVSPVPSQPSSSNPFTAYYQEAPLPKRTNIPSQRTPLPPTQVQPSYSPVPPVQNRPSPHPQLQKNQGYRASAAYTENPPVNQNRTLPQAHKTNPNSYHPNTLRPQNGQPQRKLDGQEHSVSAVKSASLPHRDNAFSNICQPDVTFSASERGEVQKGKPQKTNSSLKDGILSIENSFISFPESDFSEEMLFSHEKTPASVKGSTASQKKLENQSEWNPASRQGSPIYQKNALGRGKKGIFITAGSFLLLAGLVAGLYAFSNTRSRQDMKAQIAMVADENSGQPDSQKEKADNPVPVISFNNDQVTVHSGLPKTEEPATTGSIAQPHTKVRIAEIGSLGELPMVNAKPSLRDAAIAGDAFAVYELADRLETGQGVIRDVNLSARLFMRAAEQGFVPAQARIAKQLEKGIGVDRDPEMAREWYRRAAEAGNVTAMHQLAMTFAQGVGGPIDLASAVLWFKRAAKHGYKDSQFNFAILAFRGQGMKTSLVQSYIYFAAAAKQGDKEAALKRDEIGSKLPPDDLAFAQKSANEWQNLALDPAANNVPDISL